jgi:hypothetical protein
MSNLPFDLGWQCHSLVEYRPLHRRHTVEGRARGIQTDKNSREKMESGTPIYVDVKHGDDGLPHSGKSGVAMSGGGSHGGRFGVLCWGAICGGRSGVKAPPAKINHSFSVQSQI